MSILAKYKDRYEQRKVERFSMEEYLNRCKDDKSYYANVHERLLKAIGEPVIIDTVKDERLSRIFSNRKIKTYPAFHDFFGLENVIESIVGFLSNAAMGLEEARQILYLLGPVGAAKSSLAERIKLLVEKEPFYTIEALNNHTNKWEISPVYESPLGVFDVNSDAELLEQAYGIPRRYVKYVMSPWAAKRLEEANGDISTFRVVKMWPSLLQQVGVTKVEPGDENNQDIASLVGKVSISQIGIYDQFDPDAYSWNGGLNVTTQGVMEFVEMFKAPLKMLNPLLTATQEGHYNGTEQFGAIPFQGLVIAHSNESEWKSFRNDKTNEAFLDRVNVIKVPYCLRTTEEIKIYRKIIDNSDLKNAPCAPGTLEALAQYSILTRIVKPENSDEFLKMEVYDGKNMKAKHPSVKSMEEYRSYAGVNEGMSGSSTRFAFKVLSNTFNYDDEERSANPIHLLIVLENLIKQEQVEDEAVRLGFITQYLRPKLAEFIGDELQKAFIENYDEFSQNLYERYVIYADHWLEDRDYKDPDTGILSSRESLARELEKIEKPAGIANPREFRAEIVKFHDRARASNGGNIPRWNSFEKIREVIEKKVFANFDEILPIISFSKKISEEDQKKHQQFVNRMTARGYTHKMIKIMVEWYVRFKNNN